MSNKVLMTPGGYAALTARLHHLKAEMPKVSAEIGVAREHGDLRENAEYHAAKEKQGMLNAEIARTETHLADAEVVDISKLKGDKVAFGATVRLSNVDTGDEVKVRTPGGEREYEVLEVSFD